MLIRGECITKFTGCRADPWEAPGSSNKQKPSCTYTHVCPTGQQDHETDKTGCSRTHHCAVDTVAKLASLDYLAGRKTTRFDEDR
jgi:hypothetical protein